MRHASLITALLAKSRYSATLLIAFIHSATFTHFIAGPLWAIALIK
jgi:hypothetical protein